MCERNTAIYYTKHNGILNKWQTFGFDSRWSYCCLNGIFPYCWVISLSGSSRNPVWSVHGFKRPIITLVGGIALFCNTRKKKGTFGSVNSCSVEKQFIFFKIITFYVFNPSAWSDGHCPHAARSHSFVYISTS